MAGKSKQADEEFLHHLYQGGELLAAGKVIEAKDHLERAYKLQPGNEKGQNLLGLTYFKLGLFDRASEIYENLVKENPADPTLRVNLGLVYLKTNALQRAIREFETATDLAPDHKKAQNYLGIALAQAKEYGRAREHFLLAGSEHMAEKMARAIAEEESSAPAKSPRVARPAPLSEPLPEPPRQEEAREELEAAEEEAAAAESEAGGGLPQQVNGVAHGHAPAAQGRLQAEDWGSHFGLDETEAPPPPAPAPAAPSGGGGEQEIELSTEDMTEGGTLSARQEAAGREGGEAPRDAELDQAFAEPVETVETVAEEPPMMEAEAMEEPPAVEPVGGEAEPLVADAVAEEVPPEEVEGVAPEVEEALPVEVSSVEVEIEEEAAALPAEDTRDRLSQEEAALREAAEDAELPPSLRKAAAVTPPEPGPEQVPPNFAEARPPGAVKSGAGRPLQVQPRSTPVPAPAPALEADLPIAELAPKVALFERTTPGPFHIGAEAVAIVVQGEMLTRLAGLVAQSGQLELTPQNRRFRGRTSEQGFGEGEAQMMRAQGKGRLVVQLPRRTFVAIDLADESGYFLESAVYAFEEAVAFENGRIPSDLAPDLDLVHLRGEGKVLLELPGLLRSLEVSLEEPVTVPLSNLVGWHGNLTPRVVSLAKDRAGKTLRAGVELSGEGYALLSVVAQTLS